MTDRDPIVDLAAAVRELAARVDGQMWPRWQAIEIAERYTSLSARTLRGFVASGRLHPSRACRGRLLFDRHEIDALMSSDRGRLRKGRGIRRYAANKGGGRERPAAAAGMGPDRSLPGATAAAGGL